MVKKHEKGYNSRKNQPCAGFSAHGVVALKYDAADPELHLEDTDVWPRHMAVCDRPNWARVGFVKCDKRQMTSCVHKMCERTYG
jgi:hypothetical protein